MNVAFLYFCGHGKMPKKDEYQLEKQKQPNKCVLRVYSAWCMVSKNTVSICHTNNMYL